LQLLTAHGHRPEFAIELDSVPLSADTPVAVAAQAGLPLVLSSRDEIVARFPNIRSRDVDQETQAALLLPLIIKGVVLGVVVLNFDHPRTFDDEDMGYARAVAQQAALAFDRARLVEAERVAVQARDDFLAVAGHELKSPLAALLLHIQSLQRATRRDPSLSRVAERIDKTAVSGARLEKLISQVLDVSRITTGRLRLEPESFDLADVVKQVTTNFAEGAAKSDTQLTVRVTPIDGCWDRAQIERLLTNLLSNALKYGRGKPVEVALERQDGHAMLSVTDHGIGIALDKQQKIFDRFERAVASREFGGFGLGLWITRQIVEASGGTIRVESEPGLGAKFTVCLPVER
jgi:signal transduction histidine kinase